MMPLARRLQTKLTCRLKSEYELPTFHWIVTSAEEEILHRCEVTPAISIVLHSKACCPHFERQAQAKAAVGTVMAAVEREREGVARG